MRRKISTATRWRRRMLFACMLLAWPLLAAAQSADTPAAPPMQMDSSAMPGVDHDVKPEASHDSMSTMANSATTTTNTRSPDYSNGIGQSSMPGMDMSDSQPLGMLKIDQLELTDGRYATGNAWDMEGWYGNDSDKLWLRSEGDADHGRIEEGQVEALWSHAVAAFWNTQLGVRQDVGEGPHRSWAAFGIQGLAPYWFELEATGYLGPSGRTAARFRAEYELLFTQWLILQPEFELNLYGSDDPASHIGSGLSNTQLGLRLRYEVSRQFAPYIGIVWIHRYGVTADYARLDGQPSMDRQFVAGVHIWF
ncbi:copper resistance protein CopB [Rhodanobacter sp. C03]|nr:copper resistance protein CopB [Rhodanobacter sp. C03]